jgi:hypothetical protein
MHRVFKAETTKPSSQNARAQQRRTDRWVYTYDQIRPHEALGQRPPGEVYRPRPRGVRKPRFSYARHWESRRVRSNGQIKWQGGMRFVGEAFVGYNVGLNTKGNKSKVYFGDLLIGELWESDEGAMRPAKYTRGLVRQPKGA